MAENLQQTASYDSQGHSIVFQHTSPVPYLHWHRELQIIWIKQGCGTAVIGKHIQPFKANEIYIIGTNQPHLFKPAEGDHKNIEMVCMYIDHHQTFSSIAGHIPELDSLVDFLQMADNGLQVPREFVALVSRYILRIERKNGFDRFVHFLDLVRVLMEIESRQVWKPLSCILSTRNNEVVDRLNLVYTYTLEHYREDISLEDVASVACMTPNAFCAYFKKHTRKTYFAFLNDLRISEACKKLLNGRYLTISAVAYDTGFISPITFNRVFRKTMGMTPSAYIARFKPARPIQKALTPYSTAVFY